MSLPMCHCEFATAKGLVSPTTDNAHRRIGIAEPEMQQLRRMHRIPMPIVLMSLLSLGAAPLEITDR